MSTIQLVGKSLLAGICLLGAQLSLTTVAFAASSPLPNAPILALDAAAGSQAMSSMGTSTGTAQASQSHLPVLTRTEAEEMAIRNNPHVSAAKLLALAEGQQTREAKSAYYPQLTGNVTGVGAHNGGRVSAGSLDASRLENHAGAGADLSQLITDFGHTHNLVLSREFAAKASNANALATTEEIVMATDSAFYNALTAQAVLKVAKETVNERSETDEQVRELTQHNLRSTLDLSFADVNLSQAKLLELDAQNNVDASMAALDAVLGLDHAVNYRLVDNTTAGAPPINEDHLISEAIAQRPDLQALNDQVQSGRKFARAERDQLLPTISAAGTAGSTPVRDNRYYNSDGANWWGGIGVNIQIPIFNGFLYTAQAKEAEDRAAEASERSRALRDGIVRDVRTAWLNANTAYQRLGVTQQLEQEADLGLKLAQARYRLGLGTIVELSQAELQQTSAQIQHTQAKYNYRLSLAAIDFQVGIMP